MLEKRIVYRFPWYAILFLIVGYSAVFYQVNWDSFVDLPSVQFLFIAIAYSSVFLAVRYIMVDKYGYFRPVKQILCAILGLYILYVLLIVALLFLLPRPWTSFIYRPHLPMSLVQVAPSLAVFFFKYSAYAFILVWLESCKHVWIWVEKRLLLVKNLQNHNKINRRDASRGELRALVRDEVAHLLRNLLQQLYAWNNTISQTKKQHVDRLLHYVLDGLSDEKNHFVTLDQEMEAVERLNQIYPGKQVRLQYPDRLAGHMVPRFMLVSLLQNCQKHALHDGAALLEVQLSRRRMDIRVYNKIAPAQNWDSTTDGSGMNRWRDMVKHFYADAAEVVNQIQEDCYLLTITIDYTK
ncbi:hypothetical protein [Sphingobacterium sp. UBA6320]|jgi:hypothetical protein|uniref:hypothetical protein n=1 Tax=Sphingobacterium sp. UBA6320 TaxID=1947510 RepID=UPI0025F94DAE|nr:hypothetical protein [Sphingobacterium sp. UBA6320]